MNNLPDEQEYFQEVDRIALDLFESTPEEEHDEEWWEQTQEEVPEIVESHQWITSTSCHSCIIKYSTSGEEQASFAMQDDVSMAVFNLEKYLTYKARL